ncbi:MAG: hypothetical protein IJJ06_04265 [Mogibacterium sp.]|nr:hypothetical protein [Mogibacterium sp.]
MLEKALEEYYEHFGQNYPLMITATVDSEAIIADIERCIATNTLAKEFEYEDGLIY